MKILVVSHMYPSTYNEIAGIFVHQQVKALKEKGIEVKVVSPTPWAPFPIKNVSAKWQNYAKNPSYVYWDEVDVYYPKYITFPKAFWFSSSGSRMYIAIKQLVKNIYRDYKFDLIHAHVALPDGYAALLLSRELNVPMVFTIHGQDLQQTIFKSKFSKEKVLNLIKNCSRCVLVSNKLKNIAIKNFGLDKKLIVVPNGIDVNMIGQLNSRFKNFNGPMLLSVSNLIYTKGIDINIKAVSRLISKYPDLKYIIIGDGTFKNQLKQLIEDLNINYNVRLLGYKDHDEVMKYMSYCNIFTLPSWKEGFGIVYLEAMAYGKPVIGCEGEGIEDFVEHGKTGLLVKPRDVDSLADALEYLLTNPDEAKAMGERARETVINNYTWENNAEKTIEIYEEVLNND